MFDYRQALRFILAVLILAFSSSCFASTVTVYRDKYGVPSIVAKSLPDAAYALGYCQATDDGLVLARNFKRARGRLAEIDGQGQVQSDVEIRALGVESEADECAPKLSKEQAAFIDSFCKGVNKGWAQQKSTLPNWIQPCTRIDALAMTQYINIVEALYTSGTYSSQMGSNEFAIAPKRSVDGHAILSMDPHLPWAAPFLWYEFAIYTPDMSFRGVTLPGLPLGVMGHTNCVAWGMTDNDPHFGTLYQFKTDTAHPKQYDYYGQWLPFTTKTFAIGVGTNGQDIPLPVQIQYTKWGPVLPGQKLAAHLIYPNVLDTLSQLLAMFRAKNCAQFRTALKHKGMSMWNIAYADTSGNIGYQYNALLAQRDPSINWDAPVDGSDPKTQWGETLTLDQLPHAENPASGLVLNCNTAPWLATFGSEISQSWPTYVTSYTMTSRYERLSPLLQQPGKISAETARSYATDTEVPDALVTVKALAMAATSSDSSLRPTLDPAIAILTKWDGRADIDSVGCALFWHWLNSDPNCPRLAYQAGNGNSWNIADQVLAAKALQTASATMTKLYGRVDIPWGEMHIQPRGNRILPVGGFDYGNGVFAAVVPNTGEYVDGKIRCVFGSSWRMVIDLDPKGIQSWSMLPYGESQNPANPHYSDQMALFARDGYKSTNYGVAGARQASVSKQILAAN